MAEEGSSMTQPYDTVFRLLARTDAASQCGTADRVFEIDAHFGAGGAWAGISDLIEAAYLDLLKIGETMVITQHDYELYMVLSHYRDVIHPRHLCLTDTARGIERTRFYPMERSYRLVHGLVGLVLQWKRTLGDQQSWRVIVRNFDHAQHLAARFVGELARRAAPDSRIDVVVHTGGDASTVAALLPDMRAIPAGASPSVATRALLDDIAADAAANAIADDDAALETNFPGLLQYYRDRQNGFAAAQLAFKVLAVYNRRGYYHEAKSLLPAILRYFDRLVGDDQAKRMSYVSEINSCLVASGDGEQALQTVRSLAVPHITEPVLLANMNYIFAMHHLRYLDAKDTERAEHHLVLAKDNLRAAEDRPVANEHAFLKAFIDNGLAFLRVRQKRHQEALDLCQRAYESVTHVLGENRHLLHRSVLQYNMAQVRVMLGQLEEGLGCYRTAIAMDPFYAEYHAEVASILEQLDRDREAIGHYGRALEYSPPYPGVYLRKAICHARLGEWPDALTDSGICLELTPDQPELHAARAEVFAELNQVEAAIAEYDRAIAMTDDSIAMRVNRAVLHYNNGAYELALTDMNEVIARDPQNPAHYENRAAIYQAIDLQDLYQRDLDMAEHRKEMA
jgi:tetratricopeptide (TPR) repeat protein